MTHPLGPIVDTTPAEGMTYREGLHALEALLNDCSQVGEDHENFVRVEAVRHIVRAVARHEQRQDAEMEAFVAGWFAHARNPEGMVVEDAFRAYCDPSIPPVES